MAVITPMFGLTHSQSAAISPAPVRAHLRDEHLGSRCELLGDGPGEPGGVVEARRARDDTAAAAQQVPGVLLGRRLAERAGDRNDRRPNALEDCRGTAGVPTAERPLERGDEPQCVVEEQWRDDAGEGGECGDPVEQETEHHHDHHRQHDRHRCRGAQPAGPREPARPTADGEPERADDSDRGGHDTRKRPHERDDGCERSDRDQRDVRVGHTPPAPRELRRRSSQVVLTLRDPKPSQQREQEPDRASHGREDVERVHAARWSRMIAARS